jgi:ClpP class serine protease
MNYPRLASRFYGSEWFVREDWHRNAGMILKPYLTGEAIAAVAPGTPAFAQPRAAMDGRIPGVQTADGFALVRIDGTIGRHLDMFEMDCGGGYDLARLENSIQLIENHSAIHTVIFSLHTPGGHAAGVPEAAQMIVDLGASKRTVAWVDNDACSAGYFLAAACGEIYGQPSAYYGSISTIMAILDQSRAYEMEGLAIELFTDGNLKGTGYPGTTISAEQRTFLENRRDQIGGNFKAFVRSRRPGVGDDSMQGGYYSGADAMERGLVDGFYNTLADLMAALL